MHVRVGMVVQMVTMGIFCQLTRTYLLEPLSGKAIFPHLPTSFWQPHQPQPGAWSKPISTEIMQSHKNFGKSTTIKEFQEEGVVLLKKIVPPLG